MVSLHFPDTGIRNGDIAMNWETLLIAAILVIDVIGLVRHWRKR